MNYTTVSIPDGGATIGGVRLRHLSYVVGKREDDRTYVHVHGMFCYPSDEFTIIPFSGFIVLAASTTNGTGSDLTILSNRILLSAQKNELVQAIISAFYTYAEDMVIDEMKRLIDGDVPCMTLKFKPLLDKNQIPVDGEPNTYHASWSIRDVRLLLCLPHGYWIVEVDNVDLDYGLPIKNGIMYLYRDNVTSVLYRIGEREHV